MNSCLRASLGFLVLCLLAALVRADQHSFVLEEEFRHVTCQSAVKLANKKLGCRLHSLGITYGTGSGQQAVTCLPAADDAGSYFLVRTAFGTPDCPRGTPIACGTVIRLLHQSTKTSLHSHAAHKSPLTRNQEVSAYSGSDKGDDWRLVCAKSSDKYWDRETEVKLQHVETAKFLGAASGSTYNVKPPGQLEVSAVGHAGAEQTWIAQEGIYFGKPE
ncbi:Stromal cell-derived factor 2-like protein 1 [Geranomyces variabilis]|nr:Stromal cell-derived factor 2-like protein 1 [Geranomyces variabilis]